MFKSFLIRYKEKFFRFLAFFSVFVFLFSFSVCGLTEPYQYFSIANPSFISGFSSPYTDLNNFVTYDHADPVLGDSMMFCKGFDTVQNSVQFSFTVYSGDYKGRTGDFSFRFAVCPFNWSNLSTSGSGISDPSQIVNMNHYLLNPNQFYYYVNSISFSSAEYYTSSSSTRHSLTLINSSKRARLDFSGEIPNYFTVVFNCSNFSMNNPAYCFYFYNFYFSDTTVNSADQPVYPSTDSSQVNALHSAEQGIISDSSSGYDETRNIVGRISSLLHSGTFVSGILAATSCINVFFEGIPWLTFLIYFSLAVGLIGFLIGMSRLIGRSMRG